MPGAFVVSGCPRSATSLEIMLLKQRLEVVGEKFPQESVIQSRLERRKTESETQHAYRITVLADQVRKVEESRDRVRALNPNGFWEHLPANRGLRYPMERIDGKLIKLVSQYLTRSDPSYINKIVYMIRDPHEVATSQENLLEREHEMVKELKKAPVFRREEVKRHSVEMFNLVNSMAARWITENGMEDRVRVVHHRDLMTDPASTMAGVTEFLGIDPVDCSIINPALYRSKAKPELDIGAEWDEADEIYRLILSGDWSGVSAMAERPRTPKVFSCARLKRRVNLEYCAICKSGHNDFLHNQKRYCQQRGIDWESMPCGYDCIVDGMTVEASVAANHWSIPTVAPQICVYDRGPVPDAPRASEAPCNMRHTCAHPAIDGLIIKKQCRTCRYKTNVVIAEKE